MINEKLTTRKKIKRIRKSVSNGDKVIGDRVDVAKESELVTQSVDFGVSNIEQIKSVKEAQKRKCDEVPISKTKQTKLSSFFSAK